MIKPGDLKEIDAFDIQVKKSRSADEGTKLTVIGVIENLAGGTGFGAGGARFYSAENLVSEIAGEEIPNNTYYFSLVDKENASDYSQRLEKIFLANGMNAESLIDNIKEERETSNAFNKLFCQFTLTNPASRSVLSCFILTFP